MYLRSLVLLIVILSPSLLQAQTRVAAVGDSITYSFGPGNPSSYPEQLGVLLGSGYDVRNFGLPGAIITNFSAPYYYANTAEHAAAKAYAPDIVISNLGINEWAVFDATEELFVSEYVSLINEYQALPSSPTVYIWSELTPVFPSPHIPSQMPGIVEAQRARKNARLAEIIAATGAIGINMYDPLKDHPELFIDGLHPNQAGAAIVAQTTANVPVFLGGVDPFPPFAAPAPINLIANGDFTDLTNATPAANPPNGAWNITGSNGNFGPFVGNTAVVDHWSPYSADPSNLIPAVNGGELSGGANGSFYLDTHRREPPGDITLNSAMDYLNGLVQVDILGGVTIDPIATYDLSFDVGHNPTTNQSQASFSLALTMGTGAAATNPANAISAALFEIISFTGAHPTNMTHNTLPISGADLLAAQGSGPVNVIFQTENRAAIPGFPGSVDPGDEANLVIVSQVIVDNLSLSTPVIIATGDVNKDGTVDQNDVDQAQIYLDGDGGVPAVDRQNTLIGLGQSSAETLAILNLVDFDLTCDDFFDATDVAVLATMLDSIPGDFNEDGNVNVMDLGILATYYGTTSGATWAMGDATRDGAVDVCDLSILATWYGTVAIDAATAAVPEPATVCMLLAVGLAWAGLNRRLRPR